MKYFFDVGTKKGIRTTTQNTHPDGMVHPHRIMKVHDILYCISGSMEVWQDGIPYEMNADDVLFLRAGAEHYGKKPCEPGTTLYVTHVLSSPNDIALEDSEPDPQGTLVRIEPLIHCQDDAGIKSLFRELLCAYWGKSTPIKKEKLSLLMNLILIRLSEASRKISKEEDLAEKCIGVINAHSDSILSPSELAKNLLVSERTLRNAFVAVFGQTPYNYQRYIKMKRAASVMKEHPEMPLKEIAGSVGYNDEFYFSKTFKKIHGMSPSAYREKIINGDIAPAKSIRDMYEGSFQVGQYSDYNVLESKGC